IFLLLPLIVFVLGDPMTQARKLKRIKKDIQKLKKIKKKIKKDIHILKNKKKNKKDIHIFCKLKSKLKRTSIYLTNRLNELSSSCYPLLSL
ncbi:hypothetical protein, partial [Endozoicomonas sp. SESOKO4]|uniref:hypothetical protein n=1 Tax=Endozoicomonas sp. SESOKO4 TaxID=2828745 RepID=UPI002149030C